MEARSEKFRRLAEARVNRSIASIRSLGKLSNRSHYEYSEEEVRKIFLTLKKEVEMANALFSSSIMRNKGNSFHFGDKD